MDMLTQFIRRSTQHSFGLGNLVQFLNACEFAEIPKIVSIYAQNAISLDAFAARNHIVSRTAPQTLRHEEVRSLQNSIVVKIQSPHLQGLRDTHVAFLFSGPVAPGVVEALGLLLQYAYMRALEADELIVKSQTSRPFSNKVHAFLSRQGLQMPKTQLGNIYTFDIVQKDSADGAFASQTDQASKYGPGMAAGFATLAEKRTAVIQVGGTLYHQDRKGRHWSQVPNTPPQTGRPFMLIPFDLRPDLQTETTGTDTIAALLVRPARDLTSQPLPFGPTWSDLHLIGTYAQELNVVYSDHLQNEIQRDDFESVTHGLHTNTNKLIANAEDLEDTLDSASASLLAWASSLDSAVDKRRFDVLLGKEIRVLDLLTKDIFLYASDIQGQLLVKDNFALASRIIELKHNTTKNLFADVIQVAVNLKDVIQQHYSRPGVRVNNLKEAGFGDIPSVRGDKSLLLLVFRNILENSIKYCSNSQNIHIIFNWSDLGDSVVITIHDNGMGILPSEQAHIFKKRFRSERAIGKVGIAGRGLGLYHCSEILKELGGKIWIEPVSSGTKFAVQLRKSERQ